MALPPRELYQPATWRAPGLSTLSAGLQVGHVLWADVPPALRLSVLIATRGRGVDGVQAFARSSRSIRTATVVCHSATVARRYRAQNDGRCLGQAGGLWVAPASQGGKWLPPSGVAKHEIGGAARCVRGNCLQKKNARGRVNPRASLMAVARHRQATVRQTYAAVSLLHGRTLRPGGYGVSPKVTSAA